MIRGFIGINLRRLRLHPFRLLLTLSTIFLAASLLVSASGLAGSAQGSTSKTARALSGKADVEVTAFSDGGFPGAIARQVAQIDGVELAAPVLQAPILVDDVVVTLVGVDPEAMQLFPAMDDMTIIDGGEGQLALGGGLADELAVKPGSTVSIATGDVELPATIRFVAHGGIANLNGGRTAIASLNDAQTFTGRSDRVDTLLVKFAQGTDPVVGTQRVADVVDGRASVLEPGQSLSGAGAALDPVNQALWTMAGLALLISAFVVFNTMSMSALERRKELALFRALGASRRPLIAQFLAEAGLMGLVSAIPGSIAGYFGARMIIDQLPKGLQEMLGTKLEFFLPAWAIPVAIIGSVVIAVVASVMPAFRAASVPPIEAMRSDAPEDEAFQRAGRSIAIAAAGTLALAGAVLLAQGGGGSTAIASAVLFFVGGVAILYATIRPVSRVTAAIAGRFGKPGKLATDSIKSSPRRLWATLTTVVLGIAVTLAIGEVAANLKATAADTFGPLGKVDLIVQPTPSDSFAIGLGVPQQVQTELGQIPGIDATLRGRYSFISIDGERLLIQGADPRSNTAPMNLASDAQRDAVATSASAIVSTQYADRVGLSVGDEFTLQTAVGPQTLTVAGTAPSFMWPNGVIAIDFDRFAEWYGNDEATFVELALSEGADAEAVKAAVEEIPSSIPLYVFDGQTMIDVALDGIAQMQSLLFSFQWLVVVAASLAIMNTLIMALLERRREFGMLRAIGMGRRLMLHTVLAETSAIVIVGGLLGVGLGLVEHWLLVQITVASGFPTDYAIVAPPAFMAVIAAVGMAFVGAYFPARQISRQNIVESISYE